MAYWLGFQVFTCDLGSAPGQETKILQAKKKSRQKNSYATSCHSQSLAAVTSRVYNLLFFHSSLKGSYKEEENGVSKFMDSIFLIPQSRCVILLLGWISTLSYIRFHSHYL